ncbi:MAG: LptF/LptG family permease [Trueperaceae bacterium]
MTNLRKFWARLEPSTFSGYLMREILPLYGAGIIAFMMLLLGYFLIELLADVLSRGISPGLIAQFLLYSLPTAAGPAIPLALLFATLLGLTRLTQDSEVKAALLLGLGPGRFLTPMLLLGLLIAVIGFINNNVIIPWGQQRAQQIQKDILLQSPELFLKDRTFFQDPSQGRSIYIENLTAQGGFENITVIQSGGAAGPSEIISAESGQPDNEDGVWNLTDVRFSTYRDNRLVLDIRSPSVRLPVRQLAVSSNGSQPLRYLPLQELIARVRSSEPGRARAEWTALHQKISEPVAAIAFAVFSLGIALVSFRRAAGLGLVAVLFLTFIYYATWTLADVVGRNGVLPGWIAGWFAVALYAVVGALLLIFSWRR